MKFKYYGNPLQKQPLVDKYFKIGCEVSGTPKPVVRWLKDGREVHICNATAASETTCFYTLYPRAQVEDDGEYTCEATNKVGRVKDSVQLVVQGMMCS